MENYSISTHAQKDPDERNILRGKNTSHFSFCSVRPKRVNLEFCQCVNNVNENGILMLFGQVKPGIKHNIEKLKITTNLTNNIPYFALWLPGVSDRSILKLEVPSGCSHTFFLSTTRMYT